MAVQSMKTLRFKFGNTKIFNVEKIKQSFRDFNAWIKKNAMSDSTDHLEHDDH